MDQDIQERQWDEEGRTAASFSITIRYHQHHHRRHRRRDLHGRCPTTKASGDISPRKSKIQDDSVTPLLPFLGFLWPRNSNS